MAKPNSTGNRYIASANTVSKTYEYLARVDQQLTNAQRNMDVTSMYCAGLPSVSATSSTLPRMVRTRFINMELGELHVVSHSEDAADPDWRTDEEQRRIH